eukprot:NODE_7255_length_326_cov_50.985560_g6518_i0.p1 GENE.NODE_7255_length_326_cov_50.985560_g6518_i0~~NODE_7255_length_326_cov_50.985560_g6518_i0.p1  ORF type:complete len:75 (+),score=10.31 NODE_7255_length_326_cov_50.985560_g6518_i0:60-284(+)
MADTPADDYVNPNFTPTGEYVCSKCGECRPTLPDPEIKIETSKQTLVSRCVVRASCPQAEDGEKVVWTYVEFAK